VRPQSLLTSEQYLALPDEFHESGERIRDELIGGELVQWPFLPMVHSLVANNIARVLMRHTFVNENLPYEVLISTGFQVGDHDTFVPDVGLVRREQLDLEARIIQGPPQLAIEVVAPSDLEVHLKHKIDAYLDKGADRVWVAYPDSRCVMIYSREGIRELRGDQKIEDPLLPGFSAPVSTFFELT